MTRMASVSLVSSREALKTNNKHSLSSEEMPTSHSGAARKAQWKWRRSRDGPE